MQPMYDFIDGAVVKDSKPFFVWYAPFMPHTPHTPPERLLKKYEPLAPTPQIAKYWACANGPTKLAGQLIDFLDERKLRENTLVIYVTDNGWIQDPNGNNYAPKSKQSPNETASARRSFSTCRAGFNRSYATNSQTRSIWRQRY